MQPDSAASDLARALPAGIFLLAIIVFAVFLAILWTLLPFAVFGIKKRLDRISYQLGVLIGLDAQARERDQGGPRPPKVPAPERRLEPIDLEKEQSARSMEDWDGFSRRK